MVCAISSHKPLLLANLILYASDYEGNSTYKPLEIKISLKFTQNDPIWVMHFATYY